MALPEERLTEDLLERLLAAETPEAHRVVWAALAECSCALLPRVRATYEMPDEFVAVCDYVPDETVVEWTDAGRTKDLANSLGDAATSSSGSGDPVEALAAALKITESSWYVNPSGYVLYAVAVANTGSDVTALFPTVVVTGRNADGSVLFSEEQVLGTLYPGETRYWGGQAGNGAAPASVEFSMARPGEWEVERGSGEPSVYAVSGVTTSQGELVLTSIAGELTFVSDGDEQATGGEVMVVAIGRDAQGKMIWGEVGYISEPAVGSTVPFEVTAMSSDLPAYETVEVYAYPW